MKKTILSLLSLGIILFTTSCKDEAKSDSSSTEEKTEVVEKKEESDKSEPKKETSSSDVPSFDNEQVQEYVNAYDEYMNEYKKAAENKDMAALGSLGEKGQALGQKTQEVMGNLSGDDVQKFNDYMQKKSAELQELTKKMME